MAWITMNLDSDALRMPVMLDVLVPQGHGNYKSLYLLHGAGGGHSSWITRTRIADYVDNKNLVVIMPSGNNKCYVNNAHGKDYYKFITEEIVNKCETYFSLSTKKEDRFIAGMSMGGYGAFNAALENSNMYEAAFSFSGLMNIIERYNDSRGLDFYPVFGDKDELLTGNYDLMEKVHKYKDEFSSNVENPTKFYLDCGLSDNMMHMSDEMYINMRDNGYKVEYSTGEGSHDWKYWDKCIESVVNRILSVDNTQNGGDL